ncbi:MAG: hypothetical protein K1X57_17065 [Gemmataceae bacterium]|nr:hypothetical protein [Gemmataceae bacterium]
MFSLLLSIAAVSPVADPDWGTPVNGLATRLALVTPAPKVGQPLEVKLDAKNTSETPVHYDDQQATVNDPVTLTGPDGKAVPYVGGSYQTMGQGKRPKPGQELQVFAKMDLAKLYLITEPGEYKIATRARGGLPASNTLVVKVEAGELPPRQKLLAAYYKTKPENWSVYRYGDGSYVWMNKPTRLKSDVTTMELHFTKSKTAEKPTDIDMGPTALGHAWLRVDQTRVAPIWPDHVTVVRDGLKCLEK